MSHDTPRLGCLELNCRRYPAMLSWYRQWLDAEVVHRDAMQAMLRAPAGWHLVLVDSGYAQRPREVAGVAGIALEYPALSALAADYRRLKSDNVYPQRALKNGLVTSLVYSDPDGNPASLRHLPAGAPRNAQHINPLGDEFDPAVLLDGL